MKKKGFTIIELLAVIVILAILALITVPIVLKLVNNARRDSAIRSAENYLDGVKKSVMNDTINSEIEIDECTVKSDGNLSCNGDVYLTVDVDGKKPTDGKIAFFNGTISDVTDLRFGKFYISGEINSLYATTKATEEGRPEGVYLVGDKITYKGERYYVIEKSDTSKDYLVLLKMWPLSKTEIENNGMDENNKTRINVLTSSSWYRAGTAGDRNGYGIVNWNSSKTCYLGDAYALNEYGNFEWKNYNDISGCPTSYDGSDIKVIVDNWAKLSLNMDDLQKVDGYKVRLLSTKDALGSLKYSEEASGYSSTSIYFQSSKTPRWAKGNDYSIWMMDIDEDRKASAMIIDYNGISSRDMWFIDSWNGATVRPVINLKKEAITKENEAAPVIQNNNSNDINNNVNNNNNNNTNNNNNNNSNNNSGNGSCLWIETEIIVYDKKRKKKYRKKIKDLTEDDLILAWDFDKGEFVFVKPLWIRKTDKADSYYLLKFSDRSELRIIHDHRIFNADTNSFESGINVKIGTKTFNSKGEIVELISREKIYEEIEYSSVITNYHMNLFAGDILTSIKLNNLYKIDNMKFIKENIVNNDKTSFCEMSDKIFDGLRLNEAKFGDYYTIDEINEFVEGITPLNKI